VKRLGLADENGGGRWQLVEVWRTYSTLRERGDFIRTRQRKVPARNLEREASATAFIPAPNRGSAPIADTVIMRGLVDKRRDRHFLLIEVELGPHAISISVARYATPKPQGTNVSSKMG